MRARLPRAKIAGSHAPALLASMRARISRELQVALTPCSQPTRIHRSRPRGIPAARGPEHAGEVASHSTARRAPRQTGIRNGVRGPPLRGRPLAGGDLGVCNQRLEPAGRARSRRGRSTAIRGPAVIGTGTIGRDVGGGRRRRQRRRRTRRGDQGKAVECKGGDGHGRRFPLPIDAADDAEHHQRRCAAGGRSTGCRVGLRNGARSARGSDMPSATRSRSRPASPVSASVSMYSELGIHHMGDQRAASRFQRNSYVPAPMLMQRAGSLNAERLLHRTRRSPLRFVKCCAGSAGTKTRPAAGSRPMTRSQGQARARDSGPTTKQQPPPRSQHAHDARRQAEHRSSLPNEL